MVSHLYFFATLNKERNSSYLQLSRRLNGKMLVLGFLYSKLHETVQQKCYCKISYGTTFDYYDPEAISQWCDTIYTQKLFTGPIFILKNILCPFLKDLVKFKCNTTSDWLNRRFSQLEVVLHLNSVRYRKVWRTTLGIFKRMVGEYGPCRIVNNQK